MVLSEEDKCNIREILYKSLNENLKFLFPNDDINYREEYRYEFCEVVDDLIDYINVHIKHKIFFTRTVFMSWFLYHVINNIVVDNFDRSYKFYFCSDVLYDRIFDIILPYYKFMNIKNSYKNGKLT